MKYKEIEKSKAKHNAISKNNSGQIKSNVFSICMPTTELLPFAFNSFAVSYAYILLLTNTLIFGDNIAYKIKATEHATIPIFLIIPNSMLVDCIAFDNKKEYSDSKDRTIATNQVIK